MTFPSSLDKVNDLTYHWETAEFSWQMWVPLLHLLSMKMSLMQDQSHNGLIVISLVNLNYRVGIKSFWFFLASLEVLSLCRNTNYNASLKIGTQTPPTKIFFLNQACLQWAPWVTFPVAVLLAAISCILWAVLHLFIFPVFLIFYFIKIISINSEE